MYGKSGDVRTSSIGRYRAGGLQVTRLGGMPDAVEFGRGEEVFCEGVK